MKAASSSWIWVLALQLGAGTAAAPGAEPPAGTHQALTLIAGRLYAPPAREADEIADVTAYCNACHGGEEGGVATGGASHPADSAARDHPVGGIYPEADPGYRSVDELDPALLLLEGRVTCVTCHAHDDAEHGTVLATEGSAICRACHLI